MTGETVTRSSVHDWDSCRPRRIGREAQVFANLSTRPKLTLGDGVGDEVSQLVTACWAVRVTRSRPSPWRQAFQRPGYSL